MFREDICLTGQSGGLLWESYKALDSQSIICKWSSICEWPCPPSRARTGYSGCGREMRTQLCFDHKHEDPPSSPFYRLPKLTCRPGKIRYLLKLPRRYPCHPERIDSAVGEDWGQPMNTVTNSHLLASSGSPSSLPTWLPHLNAHPDNSTQCDPVNLESWEPSAVSSLPNHSTNISRELIVSPLAVSWSPNRTAVRF